MNDIYLQFEPTLDFPEFLDLTSSDQSATELGLGSSPTEWSTSPSDTVHAPTTTSFAQVGSTALFFIVNLQNAFNNDL